jgi:hypothetical protein
MTDPIPDFHDGYFDGFCIGPNKSLCLFLRTVEERFFKLTLRGVQALTLSDVRAGNIILDLVFKLAPEATPADIAELYGVDADTSEAKALLKSARERGLEVLEINPSYGAHGTVLFENWEIIETEVGCS